MAEQQYEPRTSEAKSEVAKKKPRDASGKFLSGAEKEAYFNQMQAVQFQAEQQRMNNLLGRNGGVPMQQNQVQQGFPQMQQIVPNNFQAILQLNKPGSNEDINRWNSLLGRRIEPDTSQNRRRLKKNNYRW